MDVELAAPRTSLDSEPAIDTFVRLAVMTSHGTALTITSRPLVRRFLSTASHALRDSNAEIGHSK